MKKIYKGNNCIYVIGYTFSQGLTSYYSQKNENIGSHSLNHLAQSFCEKHSIGCMSKLPQRP